MIFRAWCPGMAAEIEGGFGGREISREELKGRCKKVWW